MQVSVAYDILPQTPSVHASLVMDHFGIGFDAGRHVIAEKLELPIRPGDVVLFTGASGSGKSSLLRAVVEQLLRKPRGCVPSVLVGDEEPRGRSPSASVVSVDAIAPGERMLVDGLNLPADETFALLASCGLGEARLMLRTPGELSDGQRYRYRLALALAQRPDWIACDEFTATLDRTLAKVIAFNLRKTARRRQAGLLLATTHDDVAEDLQPDLHVHCGLDGILEVRNAKTAVANRGFEDVKKKRSASPPSSNSRPARNGTGRISLGGIIAATTSGSSAG